MGQCFISMASTSCHLQTMRANVNFPHAHFRAGGATGLGADIAVKRGGPDLDIYIRKCDWVALIDLAFASRTTGWGVEEEMCVSMREGKLVRQLCTTVASHPSIRTSEREDSNHILVIFYSRLCESLSGLLSWSLQMATTERFLRFQSRCWCIVMYCGSAHFFATS